MPNCMCRETEARGEGRAQEHPPNPGSPGTGERVLLGAGSGRCRSWTPGAAGWFGYQQVACPCHPPLLCHHSPQNAAYSTPKQGHRMPQEGPGHVTSQRNQHPKSTDVLPHTPPFPKIPLTPSFLLFILT